MNKPTLWEILEKDIRFIGEYRNSVVWWYIVNEKDFCLSPSYQRQDVWTLEQRENFIRSLFERVPIPPIIINDLLCSNRNHGDIFYNVIDGRQRLTTLFLFVNDKLIVDGIKYSSLSEIQRRIMRNCSFPVVITQFKTEEEEAKYYNLYNFSWTPHVI